jgi:hypothetical protein
MPVAPTPEAAAVRSRDAHAVARTALGVAIAAIAVVAGVGWLYLLRDAGLLSLGPRVHDALPLQQLAGDDGQPLLRMAGAWLPTGAAAAAALARLRVGHPAAVVTATGLLMLVLTGAASDAVVSSERLLSDLLPQSTRAGVWVALVLLTVGAALAGRRRPLPAR